MIVHTYITHVFVCLRLLLFSIPLFPNKRCSQQSLNLKCWKNQTWFLFETSTIKMLLVVLVVLWRCFFFLIWLHYFYYCCSFRTGDCMESHFAYVTLLGFCSETWIQKPCFPPCQANIRYMYVCDGGSNNSRIHRPPPRLVAKNSGMPKPGKVDWIVAVVVLVLFRFCRKCLFNSIENCCIV